MRQGGTGGGPTSDDPTSVRSVAVTVDDVVAALEASTRGRRTAVLRITPPFAARERARLHVAGGEGSYDGEVAPIHLDPRDLVDADAPAYPEVDETARAAQGYDVEEHYDRHVAAVDEWRQAVREHVADRVSFETDTGTHEVRVLRLG